MRNKDIAIENIELLYEKRKKLAVTAEYIMSVDSFNSKEIANEFNISMYSALSRIDELRKIGFIFKTLSRSRHEGMVLRLVDCEKWVNYQKKKAGADKPTYLMFVEKSELPPPQISDLWKVAFGLVEPDFSKCDVA